MIKSPSFISHFLVRFHTTQHEILSNSPFSSPKFQLEMVVFGTPTKSENKRTKIHKKTEKNFAHTHSKKKETLKVKFFKFDSFVAVLMMVCVSSSFLTRLFACLPSQLLLCFLHFFTHTNAPTATLDMCARVCVCESEYVCLVYVFCSHLILIFQPTNTQHYTMHNG